MSEITKKLTNNIETLDEIPYFMWDYFLTNREIKKILESADDEKKVWLIAKIMCDAKFNDIWRLLDLKTIFKYREKLNYRLGKKKIYGISYLINISNMEFIKNNTILMDLQKRVLLEFFRLTDEFFLTDGTALSAFYLYHRYFIDLDFFTNNELAFNNSKIIIKKLCDNLRIEFDIKTDTFYFKHFDLFDKLNNQILTLHFSNDICENIFKNKKRFDFIIVDNIEEILINKITAILGQSEAKDLIDLYFLTQTGYDILKYLDFAKQKDGGLENEVLAYCLNNINLEFNEQFLIKSLSQRDLIVFERRCFYLR